MPDRPRYMISVAAELAGLHPQTLRMYEARGLVRPARTPGGTRLYSEHDVERLRLVQRLTTELGRQIDLASTAAGHFRHLVEGVLGRLQNCAGIAAGTVDQTAGETFPVVQQHFQHVQR